MIYLKTYFVFADKKLNDILINFSFLFASHFMSLFGSPTSNKIVLLIHEKSLGIQDSKSKSLVTFQRNWEILKNWLNWLFTNSNLDDKSDLSWLTTVVLNYFFYIKVSIDNNVLTLAQLSYIWLSFGVFMFLSSFFFLDWKFPLLNLPYKFDTKFEKVSMPKIHG